MTKIKNNKVYKNDNESGVPAENIRIIVCLTRNSANLFVSLPLLASSLPSKSSCIDYLTTVVLAT